MLEKNLKHYRLMRAYSKRDLAENSIATSLYYININIPV